MQLSFNPLKLSLALKTYTVGIDAVVPEQDGAVFDGDA